MPGGPVRHYSSWVSRRVIGGMRSPATSLTEAQERPTQCVPIGVPRDKLQYAGAVANRLLLA
eukprot:2105114-Lingulodinium_polyedra.AAC.1